MLLDCLTKQKCEAAATPPDTRQAEPNNNRNSAVVCCQPLRSSDRNPDVSPLEVFRAAPLENTRQRPPRQECRPNNLSLATGSLLNMRGRTRVGLNCKGLLAFLRELDNTRALVAYTRERRKLATPFIRRNREYNKRDPWCPYS